VKAGFCIKTDFRFQLAFILLIFNIIFEGNFYAPKKFQNESCFSHVQKEKPALEAK
jgi:hypothetical protein